VARDQLYRIKSQNILYDCSKRLKKFHSFRTAEDKFLTSGYIVQAYCDSGDYDQMLQAVKIKNLFFFKNNFKKAKEQVELANNQNDDLMRSEALLNLARANERLAEYEKAIDFAEQSLALPGIDRRSPGYAHLGR